MRNAAFLFATSIFENLLIQKTSLPLFDKDWLFLSIDL